MQHLHRQGFYAGHDKCHNLLVVVTVALIVFAVMMSASRTSSMIPSQEATSEATLLPPLNLTDHIQGRKVSIKVGVLFSEPRPLDEFWVEFDPTNAQDMSQNRLLLPYAVAPSTQGLVSFYIHKSGGCSSLLLPKDSPIARETYIYNGLESCNHFIASSSPSAWKIWDQTLEEDDYRSRFEGATEACYGCQKLDNVSGVKRFPAIALHTVLQWFDRIDTLDIDAQGLDVALLLSLPPSSLGKIQRLKFECQLVTKESRIPYLYHNRFEGREVSPNECRLAENYLNAAGFLCSYENNNCGCNEYNVFCSKLL